MFSINNCLLNRSNHIHFPLSVHLNCFSAVELESTYLKTQDQINSADSRVIIGAVVGSLALVALATLVIAGLVAYRRRSPKNYEKLPLIVDE